MMQSRYILFITSIFVCAVHTNILCQDSDSCILLANNNTVITSTTAVNTNAVLSTDLANEYFIETLNQKTPLELEYNAVVKKSIDYFLSVRRHDIEIYLGRSINFFPVFEQTLDKYNLPLELKYIAVIESGLNPLARSSSGAVGLWQFLYNTCSLFDLQVDSYIDERRDVYKSTDAACRYLEYLYNTFHDWNLVLASYNGGPGEVRNAIERSGGKTGYWDIRPYLSKQAADYVPNFIAVIYLMNYYQQYGLVPVSDKKNSVETDTVKINYGLSFVQISEVLSIPICTIEQLNPVYKSRYIPKHDLPCTLVLPKTKISDFLSYERKIIEYKLPVEPNYISLLQNAGNTNDRIKIVHVVEKGEYFHKIAVKYNCTIENIKAWNNLNSLSLYPGQVLDIWVREGSSL